MKVGVIGYGGMGKYHCEQIKKMNNGGERCLTVECVCDWNEERRKKAESAGYKTYASAMEMLENAEIDGVFIVTENDEHLPLLTAAAMKGKHVFCEKPVSLSVKQTKTMFRIAEKYGVAFCIHQNRRYDGDYLSVKKIAEDGKLGEIYRVRSEVSSSHGLPGRWRKEKEHGGGMMLDWGVHLIDQMVQLYGTPKSVGANYTYVFKENVDDGFTFTARYKGGLEYIITVDTNCFQKRPRWVVYGTEGTAEITDWDLSGSVRFVKEREDKHLKGVQAGNGLTKTMAQRSEETVETVEIPKVEHDPFLFYRNFALVAQGKEAPLVKKEDALTVMRIMEAAERSSKKGGKPIEIG